MTTTRQSDPAWTDVDRYATDLLVNESDAQRAALDAANAAGMPSISVTPPIGKFLQLLAQSIGARRILEVGTLAGYSAIWFAHAVAADAGRLDAVGGRRPGAAEGERRPGAAGGERRPGAAGPTTEGGPGSVVTLEVDPKHAAVARDNIARAGFSGIVDVRLGPATETLQSMIDARIEPFDLVFIDADKQTYAEYLRLALQLSRVGTLIIADNVVRRGAVVDANSTDERVQGVRKFNEEVARNPRLDATMVQTVGAKGYDGFTLARVIT